MPERRDWRPGRRPEWRSACVTRAITIADGVRMIEFAVEGALPPFQPGWHAQVQVDIGGAIALRAYARLPAAPGCVRLAVRRDARGGSGSRFMWSLLEGARARLAVPATLADLAWPDQPTSALAPAWAGPSSRLRADSSAI